MTRINTNVESLLAQRILGQQNSSLTRSLERLSTGLSINRGADDPAGLIASENLRSEEVAIATAIGNAERAEQVVNIAEGGVQEISALLIEVQALVGESANEAGLSTAELEANQLQIDSIIQVIDRIASSASFQGTKLLNGTFDFTITNQATTVDEFQINAAKLSFGQTRPVQVVVTASAQNAGLYLSAGAAALDLTANSSSFIFEIAGSKGSREFNFASGTTLTSIASSVNTFKSLTGVSGVASGTGIVLKSTEFGSREFVSFLTPTGGAGGQAGAVHQLSSTDNDVATPAGATAFAAITNSIRDDGQDVGAIINGITASSNGKTATIASDFLDLEITLTTGGAQTLASIAAFTITGGGAVFNLGPNVDILNQVSLGIRNVASRNLGSNMTAVGGFLDDLGTGNVANVVDGDKELAQRITNEAISRVSTLRGRLGAFEKNVIGATIRSLGIALENTAAAESVIRDTDFAAETAELTRSQILVNAATNVLSIANTQPQAVLQLLS